MLSLATSHSRYQSTRFNRLNNRVFDEFLTTRFCRIWTFLSCHQISGSVWCMACDNGQFILRGTFPLNIFIIHILADPWHGTAAALRQTTRWKMLYGVINSSLLSERTAMTQWNKTTGRNHTKIIHTNASQPDIKYSPRGVKSRRDYNVASSPKFVSCCCPLFVTGDFSFPTHPPHLPTVVHWTILGQCRRRCLFFSSPAAAREEMKATINYANCRLYCMRHV